MSSSLAIGPNVDAYGAHAKAGALADYLEVNALLGRSITRAALADITQEQGWGSRARRAIIVQSDDPEDDPEAWAEMAFSEIDARTDILAESYPFEVVNGGLIYAGQADPASDTYISLLAITVVHAWKLGGAIKPTEVLEDVVRRTLEAKHLIAAGMGTADRKGISFPDNLMTQGIACGLRPTDNPTPRSASAKDAGVDTLGVLLWPDNRSGQWIFIGQATCGSSATWARKLNEPEPERWRRYLQEMLPPQRFLAVPHHVDRRKWADLMVGQAGLVLDRLRLCPAKGVNSAQEQALIRRLLEATPE